MFSIAKLVKMIQGFGFTPVSYYTYENQCLFVEATAGGVAFFIYVNSAYDIPMSPEAVPRYDTTIVGDNQADQLTVNEVAGQTKRLGTITANNSCQLVVVKNSLVCRLDNFAETTCFRISRDAPKRYATFICIDLEALFDKKEAAVPQMTALIGQLEQVAAVRKSSIHPLHHLFQKVNVGQLCDDVHREGERLDALVSDIRGQQARLTRAKGRTDDDSKVVAMDAAYAQLEELLGGVIQRRDRVSLELDRFVNGAGASLVDTVDDLQAVMRDAQ